MNIANLLLYALLGFLLNSAGVGVFEQTAYFFSIVAVVVVINILKE
jgi:hypothetical protein